MELSVEGTFPYSVSVKASNDEGSGTKSPVTVSIYGDEGVSAEKLLSMDGIKPGQVMQKTLNLKDIGEIQGYTFFCNR